MPRSTGSIQVRLALRAGRFCAAASRRAGLAAMLAWALAPAAVEAQNPNWRPIHDSAPHAGHTLAYDFARGRLVRFAGGIADTVLPGTWQWDGDGWAELATPVRPTPRYGHAMASDPGRRQIVLFGGIVGSTVLEDTWSWDGAAWRQEHPVHVPARRYDHAMAADPDRQVIALFGGRMGPIGAELFDLYEWNGSDWIVRGATVHPQARMQAAMAFDPSGRRLVMFGGFNLAGTLFGDMWAWDGFAWSQLTPATLPPARSGASMVSNPGSQQVILRGGTAGGSTMAWADQWIWSNGTWTQQNAQPAPSASTAFVAGFDEARHRLVVCGSLANAGWHSETWEFDGVAWQLRHAVRDPANRQYMDMTYDAARERVVMFGGTFGGNSSFGDTWEHDGYGWIPHNASGPAARYLHAMAFSPTSGTTVLFGGGSSFAPIFDDTWEWDGSSWTQRQPVTRPSIRWGHRLAFDHASGRVLLFGGSGAGSSGTLLGDTWAWNGSDWQQLQPFSSPTPRSGHAMAGDPQRRRIVLFGGSTAAGGASDTWEWDGGNWLAMTPVASPNARSSARMVFDAGRQRIMMYGGGWSSSFDETWEWDGSSWQRILSPMTPGQDRFGHGLAFHAGIGRTLLFAGPGWRYDTWIYGNLVPASVQTFGAGCAGSIGVPDLQIGDPYVGNPLLAFDLMDVQPAAACLFGVDFATQSLPLGGGCTAWLQNPALYFVPANTCGCASLRLAIPRATGLRGAVFYAQAATLDVLGPANGLALSAARRLTLGD